MRPSFLCCGILLSVCLNFVPFAHGQETEKPELHPLAAQVQAQLGKHTGPFCLVVQIQTMEGNAAKLIDIIKPAIAFSRAEPANIRYDFNQATDNENAFVIYERWRSIDGLEQHLRTPEIEKLLAEAFPLLDGEPKILALKIVEPKK